MASLLTPADYLRINNALRDTTDTFANNPCTYRRYNPQNINTGTIPRFNESGSIEDEGLNHFTLYPNLDCFVEDTTKGSKEMLFDEKGGIQQRGITVLFNFDYLNESGLVDAAIGKAVFDNARDEILWKGKRYRITDIKHDGLLNEKYTIVELFCTEQDYTTASDGS